GAVVIAKPVIEVVAHAAHLADASGRFNLAGLGPIPEVAPGQLDFLPREQTLNPSAKKTAAAVEPAIQPPTETIHPGLVIVRGETRDVGPYEVGPAIAISIFGIKDIRRGTDERAFAPRHHAGGKGQAVQEKR